MFFECSNEDEYAAQCLEILVLVFASSNRWHYFQSYGGIKEYIGFIENNPPKTS